MKGLFFASLFGLIVCMNVCGMQTFVCGGHELQVRPLAIEDYDRGYLSLLEQLTVVGVDQITFEQFSAFVRTLSVDHLVVVIQDVAQVRIVAAATLFIEHKCIHGMGAVGHIEDVVVDSRLRGLGLGRMVVDFLVVHARAQSCYKVILDCSTENVPFYEKCGFVPKGVEMAKYF